MKLFSAVLLAAAATMPAGPLCGQEPAPGSPSVSFSVMVGMSRTGLAGKDVASDLERRSGILAGFSFVAPLQIPRWDAEVDVLYSQKGFRSLGTDGDFELKVSYVELPVLVRWNLAPTARVRPFLAAGPAIGYSVICKYSDTSVPATGNRDCLFESLFDVNRVDVSAVAGGGVSVAARSTLYTVGTRFTRGFTSVFPDLKNHNQALSLYLSFSKAR